MNMMPTTQISIWHPDPKDIVMISLPDEQGYHPVGVRFGTDTCLFLAATTEQHEGQFMDTINRCDQILEVVNAVRNHALKRLAALRPDEEIVAIISDAEEVDASQPAGWDGAGASVEAQRG